MVRVCGSVGCVEIVYYSVSSNPQLQSNMMSVFACDILGLRIDCSNTHKTNKPTCPPINSLNIRKRPEMRGNFAYNIPSAHPYKIDNVIGANGRVEIGLINVRCDSKMANTLETSTPGTERIMNKKHCDATECPQREGVDGAALMPRAVHKVLQSLVR